jgi:hypothetical protein
MREASHATVCCKFTHNSSPTACFSTCPLYHTNIHIIPFPALLKVCILPPPGHHSMAGATNIPWHFVPMKGKWISIQENMWSPFIPSSTSSRSSYPDLWKKQDKRLRRSILVLIGNTIISSSSNWLPRHHELVAHWLLKLLARIFFFSTRDKCRVLSC